MASVLPPIFDAALALAAGVVWGFWLAVFTIVRVERILRHGAVRVNRRRSRGRSVP